MSSKIREVTLYQTADGELYDTIEEAERAEAHIRFHRWYGTTNGPLSPMPDFDGFYPWLEANWESLRQHMNLMPKDPND